LNSNNNNTILQQRSSFVNNNTAQQQQQSSTTISRPSSRVGDASSRPSSRLGSTHRYFQPIDTEENQLNEFDSFNFVSHHEFDDDEAFIVGDTQIESAIPSDHSGPQEWDGANPDAVIARLKALKETVYTPLGLKPFYKSYTVWSKLNADQQDKALAWFRKLPEHVKC
jgi:hypothetical protein